MKVVRVKWKDEIDRSKFVNVDYIKFVFLNADGSDMILTADGELLICHNERFEILEMQG